MVVRPVRRPEGSARAHVDDGLKRGTARGDSATNAAAHSIAASSSTAITVKGGRMGRMIRVFIDENFAPQTGQPGPRRP
jgi:hypothetical protein